MWKSVLSLTPTTTRGHEGDTGLKKKKKKSVTSEVEQLKHGEADLKMQKKT